MLPATQTQHAAQGSTTPRALSYCRELSHAFAPSTRSALAHAPSTNPHSASAEGSAKSSSMLLMLAPQLLLLLEALPLPAVAGAALMS